MGLATVSYVFWKLEMSSTDELLRAWTGLAVVQSALLVYILAVAADVVITDRKRAKDRRRWDISSAPSS